MARKEIHVDVAIIGAGTAGLNALREVKKAGIALDANGLPIIDGYSMRAGGSALCFAGDIDTNRPLMHEAADEGAIAGFNAAHHAAPYRFRRRTALSIVFSDPDIAAVGVRFDQLDLANVVIGAASGAGNGRSRILGAESGMVRIYAQRGSGTLLGASVFGVRGEHLAHLLACGIQFGMTAQQMLELPFYHPTMEEMVQSALQDIVRQQGGSDASLAGLPPLDRPH